MNVAKNACIEKFKDYSMKTTRKTFFPPSSALNVCECEMFLLFIGLVRSFFMFDNSHSQYKNFLCNFNNINHQNMWLSKTFVS